MDYDDLVDLFEQNDVFFLSWTNGSSDPRRLQDAVVRFHAKDAVVSVPLTDETASSLVTIVQVCLEQKACVVLAYDIKDLVVALRHSLRKEGWVAKVDWPAKVFDLCYIERFSGVESEVPQNLLQAHARFKKHYDKGLFSIHRDIHIPLAMRIVPRIEGIPVLKMGEGHLYSHYLIEGTTYGRLNCDKPAANYYTPHTLSADEQILPSKEGQVFLSLDYHAMEVAVLQAVSGDRRLGRILDQPDVYEAICRYLFECSREEAAKSRPLVKSIFLPIMYGMTPPGVSKQLGVSYDFAEKIFTEVHAKFPQASGFMVDRETEATNRGIASDCLGRRRLYPDGGRAARNGSVQGPAAMHCQAKLIELSDALDGMADVVASIHDGYLMVCHRYQVQEVVNVATAILQSGSTVIPGLKLKVKARCGGSLGDLKEINGSD